MTDFALKSNDTVPIRVQLTRDSGPVDLSTADVKFHMEDPASDEVVVDADATIDDAANGEVSYHWTSEDTADAGIHIVEWEVTFNPGTTDEYIETFPRDDYMRLNIVDDIA